MGIPIGKMALYAGLGGINPAECLPVTLDCGTNTDSILANADYIGLGQVSASFVLSAVDYRAATLWVCVCVGVCPPSARARPRAHCVCLDANTPHLSTSACTVRLYAG